jgi:hypothetical protein
MTSCNGRCTVRTQAGGWTTLLLLRPLPPPSALVTPSAAEPVLHRNPSPGAVEAASEGCSMISSHVPARAPTTQTLFPNSAAACHSYPYQLPNLPEQLINWGLCMWTGSIAALILAGCRSVSSIS